MIGNNAGGNGVAPQNAGKIDMPTIWNYSLSAEEIEQYMNCPPIGVESDEIITEFNFEDSIGTTIHMKVHMEHLMEQLMVLLILRCSRKHLSINNSKWM